VHARDLTDPAPVVPLHADAAETLRRLVAQGWDGLVAVDGPRTVATVSLAQSLRLLLPDFVEDDESLARVYAEAEAEALASALVGRRLGDVLPQPTRSPVLVRPSATLLEVAAAMATRACSIVAVVEHGTTLGAVGTRAVLRAAFPP
jgi:hypothetical protein